MHRKIAGAVVGAAALGAVVLGLATPAAAETAGATTTRLAQTSQVAVVHGIPGQPVDVYVNGEKILSDFQPATVAGPLALPAGSYDIVVTRPGDPVSNALIQVDDVEVPADQNLSLVAHLTAGGEPTLTAFVNDTSAIAAGQARLVARHTAAAPAVDVLANGQRVFQNLTNPNEAQADVDAGTLTAEVVLAGTETVVLGPTDLDLAEGTVTIAYVIGSAEDQTLTITTQVIPGHGTAPTGVPAGSGGLADSGRQGWWYATAGAGALLLLGGVAVAARRHRKPISM